MSSGLKFTDENIRKIFGSYDGEGENLTRLSEYFLKTDIFESIISNVPVKLLVGSKGVGKSALFRIAIKEGKEKQKLCILIKPDHIAEIGEKHESLMLSIRKFKYGLTKLIAIKVLEEFSLFTDESIQIDPIKFGGRLFPLILDIAKKIDPTSYNQFENKLKTFNVDNPIEIYIDDVDRGWQNRKEGLIMISALINSIRDMSSENEGLIFKMALRTDVYYAIRTEDESADKFEGLVSHYTYKIHEIFVLLIKRILTYHNEAVNEQNLLNSHQGKIAHHLNSVFEETFHGNGEWAQQPVYKVLLSLIRNRPRDLIKLCTLAAQKAKKYNSKLIRTQHLEEVLPEYSKAMMNDTIAEYKAELPSIDRLLYGMKPNKKEKTTAETYFFTSIELKEKLYRLGMQGEFKFASGKSANPQDLIGFLFKIGFLTATKPKEGGGVIRKTFEEANHLSSNYLDFGFNWEVHMGYRWAIQPETLDDIFARLKRERL